MLKFITQLAKQQWYGILACTYYTYMIVYGNEIKRVRQLLPINMAFILIWPLIDFCADFCLLFRPFWRKNQAHPKLLAWPLRALHLLRISLFHFTFTSPPVIELMVRIFMRIVGPSFVCICLSEIPDTTRGQVIDFWALRAGKTVQWT